MIRTWDKEFSRTKVIIRDSDTSHISEVLFLLYLKGTFLRTGVKSSTLSIKIITTNRLGGIGNVIKRDVYSPDGHIGLLTIVFLIKRVVFL